MAATIHSNESVESPAADARQPVAPPSQDGRSHAKSLSICIVSGESRATLGGLAAYNRNLARGLRDAGASVACVSRFDRDLACALDYDAGTAGVGRTIDEIATTLVGPAAWARPLLPRLRHLTGRPLLRRAAARYFEAAYARAFAAAVPDGVDVVHFIGSGWELLGFAALREARRRGARFTLLPAVHPGTWGDSPLDIDLYRAADAVFCLSNYEIDHLAALGVPREKLVHAWLAPSVPMTGDGRRFRDRHGLADRPIVLFIARKVRSKGFHALCEAMTAVAAQIPGACLVALGPDGEPPYPAMPAGAYLDLGPADDATKADALAACDVFCLPSAAESFGIVYVEAWAYGKPVVGGPAPASRELIGHVGGGICVGQKMMELSGTLKELLSSGERRSQVGRVGRTACRDRFNWAAVIGLHAEEFARHAKPR